MARNLSLGWLRISFAHKQYIPIFSLKTARKSDWQINMSASGLPVYRCTPTYHIVGNLMSRLKLIQLDKD